MKSIFRSDWIGFVKALLVMAFACCVVIHPAAGAERKLRVTTTVNMVTDLVQQVGGDRVAVQGLMGAGVDPHLYKATASDLTRLQRADAIFYCGLLLEGKLQDVLTRLGRSKKHVYAVTDGISKSKLLAPPELAGHYDPHIWFDVTLWSECVDVVAQGLSAADPAGKSYFEQRGKDYKARLRDLHEWAVQRISELPKERRILATSHDAFNYFGRAYDFKVVGLQGISTAADVSLSDVVKMVEFIKRNEVKAVFVESSVPHKTIERVSRDANVKIGGELFSDALGTPGQMENGYDLGTYDGMIRHNVNTIVDALK